MTGAGVGEAFNQEVRAAQVTGTGTPVATGAVVTGLYISSAAGGGAVTLRDGGAGGIDKLTVTHPAVAGGTFIPIPGGKMTFGTDVHATLAAGITAVTVFYR